MSRLYFKESRYDSCIQTSKGQASITIGALVKCLVKGVRLCAAFVERSNCSSMALVVTGESLRHWSSGEQRSAMNMKPQKEQRTGNMYRIDVEEWQEG